LFTLALYLAACHTPEAATTVFKCSWGWTQRASETCRVIIALTNKHAAKLHHVGSLYILYLTMLTVGYSLVSVYLW